MIKKIRNNFIMALIAFAGFANAQNAILVNDYVKAGVNLSTGTLGSGGATRPGLQFDSTGTGTFPCDSCQGDYLTPGSPFEGYTVRIEDDAGTLIRNYTNINTGSTSITGGVWTAPTTSSSAIWSASTTDFNIKHTYSLPSGQKYIDINTQIDALTAMPKLYFGRFIDPDAMPATGDTSSTDNVLGYGAIPAKNVAFAEATVSRYALGLYTGQSTGNYGAGISSRWSTNPVDYLNNTDGQTVVRGDYTIGVGFMMSGVGIGDIVNFRYAYIFGPNAFGAASYAVDGGAGGGTAGTVPGGGTLTDVGSATSAASTPTVTVTGTTEGTPTVTSSSVSDTPTVSTATTTPVNTRTGLAATVITVQTVTTTTPITTTTITTPTTVTTYSDSTSKTTDGTPITTVATVDSVSITSTTTTVTEGIETSLPVITASLAHHTASEAANKQTIARETTTNVTTPVTKVTTVVVDTDGTTISSNGSSELLNDVVTTVVNDSFSGRIDQDSKLAGLNKTINSGLDVTPFTGDLIKTENGHFFLIGGKSSSTMMDGYSGSTDTFKVGGDVSVDTNWNIGAQYSKVNTNIAGIDSSTSQKKDAFGLYSTYKTDDDVVIVGNIGYADNAINGSRNVENVFNNAHSTTGKDLWVNVKVYAPEINDSVRPFIGVTLGKSTVNGYTESGSIQSARTVQSASTDISSVEGGVMVNKKIDDFALSGEFSISSDAKMTAQAGVSYSPDKNVKVGAYATTQQSSDNKTDSLVVKASVLF